MNFTVQFLQCVIMHFEVSNNIMIQQNGSYGTT